MINNHRFDTIVSKFWGLLQKEEQGSINYDSYEQFMKCVNIALLPHFKKKEMEKEIKEEWGLDTQGANSLSYI